MGKKRSKTSKQKQNRAKHSPSKKSSSLGGVKMTKGHSSKFRQSAKKSSATVVVPTGASSSKQLLQNHLKTLSSTPSKNPLFHKTKRKVFLSPQSATAAIANNRNSSSRIDNINNNINDEEKEYQRQMASMRERQLASDFKKKELAQQKQVASSSSSFDFLQPASFSIEKTTQELLQETVQQMQSMEGVGQSRPEEVVATPIRTNQSWSIVKEPPAFAANSSSSRNNNPFEVLAEHDNDSDDDDDDNEWSLKSKTSASTSMIQLAPASFSLLPRITPTPATTPCRFDNHNTNNNGGGGGQLDDEIDPDL